MRRIRCWNPLTRSPAFGGLAHRLGSGRASGQLTRDGQRSGWAFLPQMPEIRSRVRFLSILRTCRACLDRRCHFRRCGRCRNRSRSRLKIRARRIAPLSDIEVSNAAGLRCRRSATSRPACAPRHVVRRAGSSWRGTPHCGRGLQEQGIKRPFAALLIHDLRCSLAQAARARRTNSV